MKKTLLPLFASLVLCTGAITTMAVTGALAQTPAASHDTQHTPAMTKPMWRHHDHADMAQHMKEFCTDGYARAVGRLAYIQARLSLTPAQEPLFNRWKTTRLAAAATRRDHCAAPHDADKHGVLARMMREEDRLKDRLNALETQRPALKALLAALTPDQKRIFDQGHDHGMMGEGMMDHGMMRHGMMDHDMMGGGMMGPQ